MAGAGYPGSASAAAAIAQAIKASGAIVRVDIEDFAAILARVEAPLLVAATGGVFAKKYQLQGPGVLREKRCAPRGGRGRRGRCCGPDLGPLVTGSPGRSYAAGANDASRRCTVRISSSVPTQRKKSQQAGQMYRFSRARA